MEKPVPGPFGHKQRIRLLLPSYALTKEQIEAIPELTFVGQSPIGRLMADWHTRSMKRGDDETILYQLTHLIEGWFGLESGWQIDWRNSDY